MRTVGVICEYNPFHLGHAGQLEKTRKALGEDITIVGVMSGNFVQRGDYAIFNKHARAQMAVSCGVDLVLELPAPFALSSARGFAQAGVYILDSIGLCDFISFGTESGDISLLKEAAELIVSEDAEVLIKEWLGKGLSYASAQQKAADAVMGARSEVFRTPNNLLGIEYIKAITELGSSVLPVAVKRTGGAHDSDDGYSASRVRKMLFSGEMPWNLVPKAAAALCLKEIEVGRGPVSFKMCELAILSRLRTIKDFSLLPDASEGLDRRFGKYVSSEPTVGAILESVKTKRYVMSRLRRMLMCACLGITAEDTAKPPPYARVLAMNRVGMKLLASARKTTKIPIITKPASVQKLSGRACELFNKEAAATDFYTLGYQNEMFRSGGQEWRQTPVIIEN